MHLAFPLLALLACTPDPADTAPDTEDSAPPEPETVAADIVLLSATSGTGASGLEVGFPAGDVETEADGSAVGEVEAQAAFSLPIRGEGYVEHLAFGPAGTEDFSFVTFVATESITNQVLGYLGTSWDEGTGFVVVGVDYQDLSAVEGATVSLGAGHGEAFVFGASLPSAGQTIPEGGMGAVSFPSVEPGETTVTVEPPEGVTCQAHPGGGDMPLVPVLADTVTIAIFSCE